MKYSLIETLMGFSVILIAILFLFFGFSLEKNINSKSLNISAIFENVTGLSVGDKVKISGITVGKIRNFKLEKDEFEVMVELEVDKEIKNKIFFKLLLTTRHNHFTNHVSKT